MFTLNTVLSTLESDLIKLKESIDTSIVSKELIVVNSVVELLECPSLIILGAKLVLQMVKVIYEHEVWVLSVRHSCVGKSNLVRLVIYHLI